MSHITPNRVMRQKAADYCIIHNVSLHAVLITTYDICHISPGRLNRVKAGLVIGGCICADDCFFDGHMDSVRVLHYD